MAEWFENWFESDEYLKVYSHRDNEDAKALFKLIMDNVSIPVNGRVLDLACGAGRHSILFAQKGYLVTAVDLSANLLKLAGKAAQDEGVEIELIRCDIRKFKNSVEYDLVANLFTSFGYFETDEENLGIFNTVYNSLKKDGFFVFDYLNKEFVEENLIARSIGNNKDGSTVIQTREITGGRVVKKIKIQKEGNEQSFEESVKLYSKEFLVEEMETRGFTVKKIFGDLKGNSFGKGSDRVIIIARK
jgi:cyclopropane fatty-acyl-phospholipid synthase-like methyltransferase